MNRRRFLLRVAAYVALAALDAWSTEAALAAGGVEMNRYMAPLVHAGRVWEAALLSVAVLTPFAALSLSRRPLVRLFESTFFIASCILRAFIVVNNFLVATGL